MKDDAEVKRDMSTIGQHFINLGRAMQDKKTKIDELARLAAAAGFRLRFSIQPD